jgi:hypothetical protein
VFTLGLLRSFADSLQMTRSAARFL